jgi:hypothetical protein
VVAFNEFGYSAFGQSAAPEGFVQVPNNQSNRFAGRNVQWSRP